MSAAAAVSGHRASRAAIMALAYPGRPFASPVREQPGALALLLGAVWEPGIPLWRDSPAVAPPWSVRWVGPEEADVLLLTGRRADALSQARRGSEAEPELGATAIWLAGEAAGRTEVVLQGPGVDGALRTVLPLPRAALARRAEACSQPPRGLEMLIVDVAGRITGLPRSTRVELLS